MNDADNYEKLERMPKSTTMTARLRKDNILITCSECKGKFVVNHFITLKLCPYCGRRVKRVEW